MRRLVPAGRNPYFSGLVAFARMTLGVETSNARTLSIQLRQANNIDLGEAGHVKAYLSRDAAGQQLLPYWYMPSGGFAIGTDGLIIPTPSDDCLFTKATLGIHSTPEQFATSSTAAFRAGGVAATKAATTALTFTAAHVVAASKFGCILVMINKAGTVSTKVVSSTQSYDTAALALAALPDTDFGKAALGYIAIANNAGTWTANTDDLTDGSDVTTATFVDAPEVGNYPRTFDLISEVDGDIDITFTHTAPAVHAGFYLNIVANGQRTVSDPIIFA